MDLEDIKVFREVALRGSMTQAAETLGYAQSSVTARIRKLEKEFNVNLFYRKANGVQITPAGEIFLKEGAIIAQHIEELSHLLNPNAVTSGVLRIGSMRTTASIHLPSLIKEYHSKYEKVELSLRLGDTKDLIDQVLNYELDLAFVAGPNNYPELIEIKAFEEEMLLVSKSRQETTSIENFMENRPLIIFGTGCYYRSLLEQYLLENKILPYKRFQFDSPETIIDSVLSGMGVSFLPKSVIEDKLQKGILTAFKLPSHIGHCTTVLIYRNDAVKTAALTSFIDLLSAYIRK